MPLSRDMCACVCVRAHAHGLRVHSATTTTTTPAKTWSRRRRNAPDDLNHLCAEARACACARIIASLCVPFDGLRARLMHKHARARARRRFCNRCNESLCDGAATSASVPHTNARVLAHKHGGGCFITGRRHNDDITLDYGACVTSASCKLRYRSPSSRQRPRVRARCGASNKQVNQLAPPAAATGCVHARMHAIKALGIRARACLNTKAHRCTTLAQECI